MARLASKAAAAVNTAIKLELEHILITIWLGSEHIPSSWRYVLMQRCEDINIGQYVEQYVEQEVE